MTVDDDLILVGRVARAHGNRGQVIVNLETDFPEERFRVGARLLVGPDRRERDVQSVRFHQGRPVIGLSGVVTMNDAEALAGAELKVRQSELAPLPDGTFHRHELIGCDVEDEQGRRIGRVAAVEGTIDRSRLVVEGEKGEVLIPLVDGICVNVDPRARRIVVNLPEGLLDLNV
jgi:16S rRNA processing protein RimM